MMAGRDISTDHLAFGATRIMNVCMAVGQAAGIASSMAVDEKIDPQNVDTDELRKKLREEKAILEL